MVERWSSKPYAWVRFLLPLQNIISKRFNPSHKNLLIKYFSLLKKNSSDHFKTYLPLTSQLLYSRRSNSLKKVYFAQRLSTNRLSFTVGPNYLFQKATLRYILTLSSPSPIQLSFFDARYSQFTYPQIRETLQNFRHTSQFFHSTRTSRQLT